MSGVEAASLVLGIISSVIAIVQATKTVYDAAHDAKGLPKEFHTVAEKLPLVEESLRLASQNLDDASVSIILSVIKSCESKAKCLQGIFDRVVPVQGSKRMDRYWKAVQTLREGGRVEELMKGILKDLNVLANHRTFALAAKQDELVAAMKTFNTGPDTAVETRAENIGQENFGPDNPTSNDAVRRPKIDVAGAIAEAHFMVPYTRNPDFTGRRSTIDKLKEIFLKPREKELSGIQTRAALFGLGGVGKSQIAIEFTYWLRDERPDISIFWIRGSSTESFFQSMHQILQDCHVPGAEDPKADKGMLFKRWLTAKNFGEWYMVVDSVDDAEIFFSTKTSSGEKHHLASYIPDCSHGSVLLTTRDKALGTKFLKGRAKNLVEVQKMSDEESTQLFEKIIGDEEHQADEIRELSSLLDNLPLALAQAAAFIEENSISLREYLEIYKANDDSKAELLSEPFETFGRDSEVSNALVATWVISFEKISDRCPRAADMLSLMSYFDRQDIPKTFLQREEDKPVEFLKAIGTLRAFSLVSESPSEDTYDMHPLVQIITRQWLKVNHRAETWANAATEKLASLYPSPEFKHWGTCTKWLPHAQAIISNEIIDQGSKSLWRLRYRVSMHFRNQGWLKKAENLSKQTLSMRQEMFGFDDVLTFYSMEDLGLVFRAQERYEEAKELYMQVVDGLTRILGPDDPATLENMSGYAVVLQEVGNAHDAEKLLVQVVESTKRIFGEKHLYTIQSMADLPAIIAEQGRLDEAEDTQRQVLKLVESSLGVEHPDTIVSINNLAMMLSRLGKFEEAENFSRRAMEISMKIYGHDHPITMKFMVRLAAIYYHLGNDKKQRELMQRAVGIWDRLSNLDDGVVPEQVTKSLIEWRSYFAEVAEE